MENKYLIDSSVWIALFIDTDTQHHLAKQAMEIVGESSIIIIPYIVFTEVVTVLTVKHSFEQAKQFIFYCKSDTRIFIVNDHPGEEMQFFLSQKQTLSFVDIALIGIALKNAYHLVTFDKKMQKLYSKNLT